MIWTMVTYSGGWVNWMLRTVSHRLGTPLIRRSSLVAKAAEMAEIRSNSRRGVSPNERVKTRRAVRLAGRREIGVVVNTLRLV